MRVLFVTHSFPRSLGDSAGSFLLHLARALALRAVEVHVIAPAAPGLPPTETLDGIEVRRFRYAPRSWETLAYTGNMVRDVGRSWSARVAMAGLLVANRTAVRRAIRDLRPDVVHAHWWFPGGLAAALAVGSGVPLVTTLHGTDVRLARTARPARALFRRVVRRADVVTAVSRFLADETRVLDPTAVPVVAPMPAAAWLFRAPAPGSPRSGLLFVGRLNEQKGLGDLLSAMPFIAGAPTLDVVGDGAGRDRLVALADSLGVAARVRWRGVVPQQGLPDLYAAASVLVVPSREEGLGLVAVEALLCETPVVAFRSGGVTDVVQDGVTGHLVPSGDRVALAAAIDLVLGDPAGAARRSREGRTRMLATFGPEAVAERYHGVYEAALGTKSGRRAHG